MRGINAAFCQRAVDLGAKVLIADLSLTPDTEKWAKDNSNVAFQKTDVMKWKDLHNIVTVAKEKFGKTPDVYVAGAGVLEPVCVACHQPMRALRLSA